MKRKIFSIILVIMLCFCSIATVFSVDESDNSFSIISPYTSSEGIAYGDNLLISVKVEANTALRFTVYSYPEYSGEQSLAEIPAIAFTEKEAVYIPEDFEKRNNIYFYTKQLNDIEPGLYSLKIDTVNDNGELTETHSKYFIVKPNSSMTPSAIYESKPSSKVLFFQSVFKSLFGSASEE